MIDIRLVPIFPGDVRALREAGKAALPGPSRRLLLEIAERYEESEPNSPGDAWKQVAR